jgi:hypothetical protein
MEAAEPACARGVTSRTKVTGAIRIRWSADEQPSN